MQRFSIDLFEENSSSAYKCVNGETVYENEPFHIFYMQKKSLSTKNALMPHCFLRFFRV